MTLISMVQTLVTRGARIVVVGGFAASIQGSVIVTEDLDVCYDPESGNLRLLATILREWDAYPRSAIVRAKRFANRPKDHRALPELEAVAAERGEWPPSIT